MIIEIFIYVVCSLVFSVVFQLQIKCVCFKCFESDIVIKVVIVVDSVEVKMFMIDWQISCLVVFDV